MVQHRRSYPVIYTDSERGGVPLAILLKLATCPQPTYCPGTYPFPLKEACLVRRRDVIQPERIAPSFAEAHIDGLPLAMRERITAETRARSPRSAITVME